MNRLLFTFLLLICVSLTADAQDTTAVDEAYSQEPSLFPPDTLLVYQADAVTLSWNKSRLVGLGLMAVCGGVAYYSHREADRSYAEYRKSGNLNELDDLFGQAQRFDRYAGWAYLGTQLGFLLTLYSFDRSEPEPLEPIQTP